MNIENISIIGFFIIVATLIYLDRKNVEIKYGIVIRKTKRGLKLIERLAKEKRDLLIKVGNFAIIVGLVVSVYGVFLLVSSTVNLILHPTKAMPAVKLIFPQPSGVKFPSFIQGIPFWYWLIAIFLVVSVHEPMHALFAKVEGIKVKELGIFLLGVIPLGAFANPDEEQLKKKPWLSKLRVYVAGSFGNFILALIVLGMLISSSFLLDKLMKPSGVGYERVIEGSPAFNASLEGEIIRINNTNIRTLSDLRDVLLNSSPGSVLEIETTKGVFLIKTVEHPDVKNVSFIGISNPRTVFVWSMTGGRVKEVYLNIIGWFLSLFGWLFAINLGVGIVNLFPLKPLDGGLIIEEILRRFCGEKISSYLINTISWVILSLILINLFGPSVASRLFGS